MLSDRHWFCIEKEQNTGAATGPYAREAALGCPACRPLPAEVCPKCSGWLRRATGTGPVCTNEQCPGSQCQPWIQVTSSRRSNGRRGVSLLLPAHTIRREERQCHMAGGARVHRTCAERLRALRLLRHEDDGVQVPDGVPLANMEHVLMACTGVSDPAARRQQLAGSLCALQDKLQPPQEGTQECHDFFKNIQDELVADSSSEDNREIAPSGALRRLLGWLVPEIRLVDAAHSDLQRRKQRQQLTEGFEKELRSFTSTASTMIEDWRAKFAWELHRRRASEQAREILRIILRSWREVTDPRQARFATRTFNVREHPIRSGSPHDIRKSVHMRGTWFQMFKASLRLVQHDVVHRNMRAAHEVAQHTFRLACTQHKSTFGTSSNLVTTRTLRNGASWRRRDEHG